MDLVVTNKQFKQILLEEKNKYNSAMKFMNNFTRDLLKKIYRKYNINLKLLIKFGTAIGGLVIPLDDYIRTKNLELNDDQIALVLIGVASTYFIDNINKFGKILEKIKEEKIYNVFQDVLYKSSKLKKAFVEFFSSLDTTIDTTTEIISYSFLIPIITDLISLAHELTNLEETAKLVTERLLLSGFIVVTGLTLNEVIKAILKKIKGS